MHYSSVAQNYRAVISRALSCTKFELASTTYHSDLVDHTYHGRDDYARSFQYCHNGRGGPNCFHSCCGCLRAACWLPPCRRRSVSHNRSRDLWSSSQSRDLNRASCSCCRRRRACHAPSASYGLDLAMLCRHTCHKDHDYLIYVRF